VQRGAEARAGGSREALALEGERVIPVPPLPAPELNVDLDELARTDAVSLFVERALGADPDFALTAQNAPGVAQVCRRLDGVPLAIELAASQISVMTPAELAQGLDRRFETLAGARRGAVRRHQTLRAAIDWSYQLCSSEERRVLARLSVFAGGCTRQAAEAVCAGDPVGARQVFPALCSLVAKSLLVAERDHPETRYRLLETIREYGEERLEQAGETQTLHGRHAEHYIEFAGRMKNDFWSARQLEADQRLRAENENFIAAINHAIDTDNADLGLRLVGQAVASHDAGYLFFSYGHYPRLESVVGLSRAQEHPLYALALAHLVVIRGSSVMGS
jgi:predicted ATPase